MKKRNANPKASATRRDIKLPSIQIPVFVRIAAAIWIGFLAATPFFLVDRLQLLPFVDVSFAGEQSTWNPPLSHLTTSPALADVPYWGGTVVLAILLATGIHAARRTVHYAILISTLAGMVNSDLRFTLSCAAAIALAGCYAARVDWNSTATLRQLVKVFVGAVLVQLAAVLSTLEFGFVALILTCLVVLPLAGNGWSINRWFAAGSIGVWVLTICLPAFWSDAYFAALLRPINWSWLQPNVALLPTMKPIWESPVSIHVLAFTLVAERWWQAVRGRIPLCQVLLLALLTAIGIGCSRYFLLACMAVLLTTLRPKRSSSSENIATAYLRPAIAVIGCVVLGQFAMNITTILASDSIMRRIDPRQWRLEGTVMLTNLEQATVWQHPNLRGQYQPVLSDRWECFYSLYDDYYRVCEDWKDWKREAYLTPKGRWAGYQTTFEAWRPVLVAVDSRDLSGLHRVSLDSKWKSIAIDQEKVVFAQAELAETRPYALNANATLLTLEFPRPTGSTEFERVIAVGSRQDSLRVSAALTALRLPFAALRVLPSESKSQNSPESIFAYCELAHRTLRFAGQSSLLDCVRALATAKVEGTTEVVEQVGLYRASLVNSDKSGSSVESGLVESRGADVKPSAEWELRQLLHQGKVDDAATVLAKINNEAEKSFYSTLTRANDVSTQRLLDSLEAASELGLPASIQAECLFYLGCVAIELGDFARAQSALADSVRQSGDSPFDTLAEFYLRQLQGN